MKTYFTLLLCLVLTGEVISQNVIENQKKYWYYRYRLLNNFIYLSDGNGPGTNLPANRRILTHLEWGDTPLTLGYYIGVLATEYSLLASANQPTDSTERELFLALEAFNRLDLNAEKLYDDQSGLPGTPSLNGFFIREDFIDLPNEFLDPASNDENFTPDILNHFSSGKVFSQFPVSERNSWNKHPVTDAIIIKPEDPTHDQIWPMLMGLSLVNILVHPTATYTNHVFMDGEVSIRQEASNIVNRIRNMLLTLHPNHPWHIINPVTGKCVESSSGSCTMAESPPCTNPTQAFDCGSNTTWASYGTTAAFCNILGFTACVPDQTAMNNYPLWQSFKQIPFNLFGSNEEDKLLTLVSIGNSWYDAFFQNVTFNYLTSRAIANSLEHFPLVHQVIFNHQTTGLPYFYYQTLLDQAPCQGPWYIDPTNMSPEYQWTSTDRCTKPWRRGGDSNFPGEYNGLDYMFYHNLYYLTFANASNLPPFINRMDLTINDNFPFQAWGITIGDDNNPAEFKAFRSITSTGVHTANANVSYIAGEEVDIDNADIQPGAEVSIDNQYFNCGTNWLRTTGEPEGLYGMNSGNMEHWASTQPFQVNLTHKTSSATTLPTPADRKDFSTIKVYPNPASTTITIELTSAPKIATSYKIFDAAGRLIQEGPLHNRENKVALQGIDQGFYLLEIISKETLESFKITKYD